MNSLISSIVVRKKVNLMLIPKVSQRLNGRFISLKAELNGEIYTGISRLCGSNSTSSALSHLVNKLFKDKLRALRYKPMLGLYVDQENNVRIQSRIGLRQVKAICREIGIDIDVFYSDKIDAIKLREV